MKGKGIKKEKKTAKTTNGERVEKVQSEYQKEKTRKSTPEVVNNKSKK